MKITALATTLLTVALVAPASAGDLPRGLYLNGPEPSGQKVVLPTAPMGEFRAGCPVELCGGNGPALDGSRVALPTQSR